jgi:hypothetical protein
MPAYIKHLIECNCILKQFELVEPPVFHKFVVFSIINNDGSIKPSYARCTYCGAIHKVTEVFTSVQQKRDTAPTLPDIEEIKTTLPEKLVDLLVRYNLDVAAWQEVKFIYDNELWGKVVILQRETEGNESYGKYLLLAGKTLWSIDTFSTEDI